jgi:hypothetical protein
MYGRLARLPVDMIIDLPQEVYPDDLDQYVEQLAERIREANLLVQAHAQTSFARMKRNYDAKVEEASYTVGQYVLFFYPRRYRGRSPKLARPNVGPFRVLRRLNTVNYVIAMTPKSRRIIAHVDKLKPWPGEAPKCWENVEVLSEQGPSIRENGPSSLTESDVLPLDDVFESPCAEGLNDQSTAATAVDDVARSEVYESDTPVSLSDVFVPVADSSNIVATSAGDPKVKRYPSQRSMLPVPVRVTNGPNICQSRPELRDERPKKCSESSGVVGQSKHVVNPAVSRPSADESDGSPPCHERRPVRNVRRPVRYPN